MRLNRFKRYRKFKKLTVDSTFFWKITYGTVLKLMHEKTKVQLHSHEVPYGSGSGQQSVTGFSVVDDSNSYWVLSISLSHFQGKVTILTTSTQGIGSSIAEHLGFANRFIFIFVPILLVFFFRILKPQFIWVY